MRVFNVCPRQSTSCSFRAEGEFAASDARVSTSVMSVRVCLISHHADSNSTQLNLISTLYLISLN